MSNVNIITKAAFGRAWNDIEPKVYAFLTGAGVIAFATYVAGLFDITLSGWQIAVITGLAGGIAGYLKKSTVRIPAGGDSSAAATLISASTPVAADISSLPAEDTENVYEDTPPA